MCSYVKPCGLWKRIRFWLYMHPRVSIVPTSFGYSNRQFLCIDMLFSCWQDFLRQNNTGKLLWQVFGVQSATLCVFGIAEDEEIMWNEFKRAGC